MSEFISTLAPEQLYALRFVALLGAFLVLFLYILMGTKFSIIRPRKWVNEGLIFYGVFFFVVVWFWLCEWQWKEELFWPVFMAVVPPFLLLIIPVYWLVLKEYGKDHPLYRRLFVLGLGGDSGRFGGVREFLRRDITQRVNDTMPTNGAKHKKSALYLGVTDWVYDYQIINRHIGAVNEQHHILCSGTGGGKSLYALTNILTCWNAGGLVFDVKGEHDETLSHKCKPKFVLDPYGVTKSHKNEWNILAEIDQNAPDARAKLQRISEAIVIEKGALSGSSEHFKENAQTILRGVIAHVLTAFDKEFRHLPAVYDLFKQGYIEGMPPPMKACTDDDGEPIRDLATGKIIMRPLEPDKCFIELIIKMQQNKAISAAPRDAADILSKVGENERGSYLSTIARAIDWCNDKSVRPMISGRHDFSMKWIKSREAWVNVAVPENFLDQQSRFIRVVYQIALDEVDNFTTPNTATNERQSLFVFDEFNKFGYFKAAEDIVNFKRSSRVKGLFVVQNLGQIKRHYQNPLDFFSNCDLQIFGLSSLDEDGLNLVKNTLGTYRETTPFSTGNQTIDVPVYASKEVKEVIDGEGDLQIFIPIQGKPLLLKRQPCYKNFKWTYRAV